mmetsp:Transcript_17167/g.65527  ORF Transcript_17167/g.65527 Transcript_17167/m.65527 type:complete len:211 (+) Transcript_17167:1681-2313(+)
MYLLALVEAEVQRRVGEQVHLRLALLIGRLVPRLSVELVLRRHRSLPSLQLVLSPAEALEVLDGGLEGKRLLPLGEADAHACLAARVLVFAAQNEVATRVRHGLQPGLHGLARLQVHLGLREQALLDALSLVEAHEAHLVLLVHPQLRREDGIGKVPAAGLLPRGGGGQAGQFVHEAGPEGEKQLLQLFKRGHGRDNRRSGLDTRRTSGY